MLEHVFEGKNVPSNVVFARQRSNKSVMELSDSNAVDYLQDVAQMAPSMQCRHRASPSIPERK